MTSIVIATRLLCTAALQCGLIFSVKADCSVSQVRTATWGISTLIKRS